ncbi:MAG: MFS transporter [Candidatus Hermodarchaeota archaeon]
MKSFDKEERAVIAYILSSVDLLAMLVPVIVIIWQKSYLTFGEMLLLQGIFTAVVLIMEVPSGALSDSWLGRRWTEVVGNGLLSVSLMVYAIANDFVGFATAETIAGVSLAMKTGNASSLLYDTLIERNNKTRFSQIVSRTTTLAFIVASAANIVGGLLGSIHLRLPLALLAIAYMGIACYNIVAVQEPKRVCAKTAVHATFKASRSIIMKPVLSILCIYTIATGVFSRLVFWAYQPLMISIGHFGSIEIGLAMASFNIIAAIGSRVFELLGKRIKSIAVLNIFMMIATLGVYGITQASDIGALLLAIYALQIIRGMSRPYFTIVQQEYLDSDERNTYNSLDSFKNSLLYTVIATLLVNNSITEALNIALAGYVLITILVTVGSLLYQVNQSRLTIKNKRLIAIQK